MNIKVEKPDTYDGDKAKDLDTWLFQVREHLALLTVPQRRHVPYAASLLRGNAALWWREACEANRRPTTCVTEVLGVCLFCSLVLWELKMQ